MKWQIARGILRLISAIALFIGLMGVPSSFAQNIEKFIRAETTKNIICNTSSPETIELSSKIPCDVQTEPPRTLEKLQNDFDIYSWKTFVALNWNEKKSDGSTIWENWKGSYEIFLKEGKEPTPWGIENEIPSICKAIAPESNLQVLRQVSKVPNVLDLNQQAFKTGPLIDQNGEYVRFNILVNRPMFEYIYNNHLFESEVQKTFGKVEFPSGRNSTKESQGTVGAIAIKAAWKILNLEAGDDPNKFHTAKVLVYTPPSENPSISESCLLQTVGLVGLHIVHKTERSPQWIWSTFEHIDNAPTQNSQIERSHYNFFNSNCLETDCEINQPPPRPWNPNLISQIHSQVVRVIPIDESTQKLNHQFQELFSKFDPNSVWQYYQLVGTQWPTVTNDPTKPLGDPAPQFLANTTMETYIQGKIPNVSSSCMQCHNNATTTTGAFSDYTYLLEQAKPKL
jgi:hypothetical protein